MVYPDSISKSDLEKSEKFLRKAINAICVVDSSLQRKNKNEKQIMAHGLILGVYTNLEFAKNMILESYPKKTIDHPKQ